MPLGVGEFRCRERAAAAQRHAQSSRKLRDDEIRHDRLRHAEGRGARPEVHGGEKVTENERRAGAHQLRECTTHHRFGKGLRDGGSSADRAHGAAEYERRHDDALVRARVDADRLGAYQVLLSGMPMDDNALARDAYEEVEPSGHFLGCAHTLRNYETAFYDAVMSDSENVESWEERGAKDAQERAFDRWQQMLRDYEAPPIDRAVDEALKDFVARRKHELPDAWY